MGKKTKKAAKNVKSDLNGALNHLDKMGAVYGTGADMTVQASAPVEAPVFGSEGIDWDSVYAEAAEAPKIVAVDHEKFNRTGMDILLAEGLAISSAAIVDLAVAKAGKRPLNTKGGYLGDARGMYLEGETAEAIIKDIQTKYVTKGWKPESFATVEEYGLTRGKKIYGDVVRQCKHLKEQAGQAAQQ